MAIIKCKMCGGSLEVTPGVTVAECEYCGTKQTLPKVNDEVIQNLFNRANNLRIKCEFDKAEQIYEKILQENDGESEAHWGIVLCKYGIEYVEDPKTFKRIPTCHRTSYDAVITDADYLAALAHADAAQRSIYEAEAKAIDDIQKNILNIVKNEKPFDVFICYKETDENGKRTVDSAIANDIYHQLTQEGLKTFYAAITLEDKLGREYEPYIFAALNSAKVMLVIGTKPEYFSAVWVKNEWSRFLKQMKTDRSKLLIPCFKDMDAYDLPEEFAHLQAQDMGKIGFINDVIRGIKKVTVKEEPKAAPAREAEAAVTPGIAPLLKRAFMFLEDGDWSSANEYCEKVLDIDPENAQAYLGKLMAELRVKRQENLKDCAQPFDEKNNYQKALRFGDEKLKADLEGYIDHIKERNENERLEGIYTKAKGVMSGAYTENAYKEAARLFETIREYKDASELAQNCRKQAETVRKDNILAEGRRSMKGSVVANYEKALALFNTISGWKDADNCAASCKQKIEEIKAREEADRLERERKAELARKEAKRIAKRNKKIALIVTPIICIILAAAIVLTQVIIPNNKYNKAVALMKDGKYTEAIAAFDALDGHKDSKKKIVECNLAILDGKYNDALALMNAGKYPEAIAAFEDLDGHKDSANKILECKYNVALNLMDAEKYTEAIAAFKALDGYSDSEQKIAECNNVILDRKYNDAAALMNAGKYTEAIAAFEAMNGYKDSEQKIAECNTAILDGKYNDAAALMDAGKYTEAALAFGAAANYRDAKVQSFALWDKIAVRDSISAGASHTVGLKADGTVVAAGRNYDGEYNVSGWKNIVAISAGVSHTVGLRADGTVVAVGDNYSGKCEVSSWKNIAAISVGKQHTVGLRVDGTVVAVGDNVFGQCKVSGWKDIVAISAGEQHTVGLRADGTVVAVGDNNNGQCDVSGWEDIAAISAGDYHTVGLRADGTVVAVGRKVDGQCDVSGWKNIVAISAGDSHTVGLRADGTVVAAGYNKYGQCNVSGWKDIVAISVGKYHTVGLRADGTVVAVGYNSAGQCNVSGWKNIKVSK